MRVAWASPSAWACYGLRVALCLHLVLVGLDLGLFELVALLLRLLLGLDLVVERLLERLGQVHLANAE